MLEKLGHNPDWPIMYVSMYLLQKSSNGTFVKKHFFSYDPVSFQKFQFFNTVIM